MTNKSILVLEDGTVYRGQSFGAVVTSYGEVVFTTSMTGYQEMLTDPSFAGQVVVPTYPLIGNYGINEADHESSKIQLRGFVTREYCPSPSHWQSTLTLDEYLKSQNIPGLSGIDTRALTRHLRSRGVMMGIITPHMTVQEALKELKKFPNYGSYDFIKEVSAEKQYDWSPRLEGAPFDHHIVIIDLGLKYNIARSLQRLGCRITVIPSTTSIEDIISLKPDGCVISPGPGDPALLGYLVDTTRNLIHKLPVMGICLGHQLIAQAMGGKTYKMKFGHRGGNHPVRDLETGRIHITTQNHGYAVDADSLKGGLEVSHMNSNDNTVEGLRHRDLPLLSIQYHAEGSPGPQDNMYLFERFLTMVDKHGGVN